VASATIKPIPICSGYSRYAIVPAYCCYCYHRVKANILWRTQKRNAAMKRHYAQKRATIVSHNVNWGRTYGTEANKGEGRATYDTFPTHTSTFTARTSELENLQNLCDDKNMYVLCRPP
jgi:hypothetical protein